MAKGKDVNVKDCLNPMRTFEAVDVTMQGLGETAESSQFNATYRDPTRKSQSRGGKAQLKHSGNKTEGKSSVEKKCPWCDGHPHSREKCPAKDAKVPILCMDGHFDKACFKKKFWARYKSRKQYVFETSEPESSDYDDDLGVNYASINAINSPAREVIAEVELLIAEFKHSNQIRQV